MSAILSRFLRFASRSRISESVRKMVSLPLASQVLKNKEFPHGVTIEILNSTHNVTQLRQLLATVFSSTREPIIEGLCRHHYPNAVSAADKLQIVEKKSEIFFSEDALAEKINEGLSLVTVRNDDHNAYVSVMFVEKYKGAVYSYSDDEFCNDGYKLLHSLHDKVSPVLTAFPQGSVAFISHGATCAEYRSTGILGTALEFSLSRLAREGFKVAYMILTTDRHARFAINHLGFHIIAEIKYNDYEDEGCKVFANVPNNSESIKAMVRFL